MPLAILFLRSTRSLIFSFSRLLFHSDLSLLFFSFAFSFADLIDFVMEVFGIVDQLRSLARDPRNRATIVQVRLLAFLIQVLVAELPFLIFCP